MTLPSYLRKNKLLLCLPGTEKTSHSLLHILCISLTTDLPANVKGLLVDSGFDKELPLAAVGLYLYANSKAKNSILRSCSFVLMLVPSGFIVLIYIDPGKAD